jgi:hypothetical protein
MTREEAKKLLGGFATGTLTPSEEQALFAAALLDQEVFNALAGEQGLREMLRDPAVKARLLSALEERPRAWWWLWKPAAVLAMAGVAAVAVLVGTRKAPAPAVLVAKVEAPTAGAAPAAPAPEELQAARPEARAKRQATGAAPRQPRSDAPREAVPPQVAITAALPANAQKAADLREAAALPAVDSLQDRAPRGGVVGGIAGGAPGAAPPPPPPAQERAALERSTPVQAFAVSEPSARVMFQIGNATQSRMQAAAARSSAPQPVGLRYSVVQREGEPTVIRFTANVNGYLSLAGAAPVALTAMQPYAAPPVTADSVTVVFSRQPQTSAEAAPTSTEAIGGETYVVNPLGAPFSFTIPLTRK